MRLLLRYSLFLAFVFLFCGQAYATHVRAGEITARRLMDRDGLVYELKFTGYFDEEGGRVASEQQGDVKFYITGDRQMVIAPRNAAERVNIGNGTTRNTYYATYRFPASGQYNITVQIDNRNDGVLNIGPPPTNTLNFFIRTTLTINSFLGLNRTPVLLNAPIDVAAVGQRYIHNPGAFDADGDSISYKPFTPFIQVGEPWEGRPVVYTDPVLVKPVGPKEDGTSPATFSIDEITGDLVWDAPSVKGLYNVAFIVEEWRNGVRIGQIVRDMQIIVKDAPNDRPKLDLLPELCVEAGTLIRQLVRAKDPNNDRLTLTTSSGLYNLPPTAPGLVKPEYGNFTVANQGAAGEVTGLFTWQTGCFHIRESPYEVLFKAEDSPRAGFPNPTLFQKLVDITTVSIRVFGPAPRNLRMQNVAGSTVRAFKLDWDLYACQVPGAVVDVYRKEGCTSFVPGACELGLPGSLGYSRIARLAATSTTFTDNNNGEGLRASVTYSYRLVVTFPRPETDPTDPTRFTGGTESKASEQTCSDLPQDMPVITHVTVDSTHLTRGVITVRWTRPLGHVPAPGEGPFQYRLYRTTGLSGSTFPTTPIATINTNLQRNVVDTLFVDRGLNTEQNPYRYKLEFYATKNGVLTKTDEIEPASSVRLSSGGSQAGQIRLTWAANVPWDNTNRVHRVYRENPDAPGVFNRIADVPVTSFATFTYLDDGADRYLADGGSNIVLDANKSYCYKVETVGSYNSRQVIPEILYNLSQIFCTSPYSDAKPCPPVLSVDILDCATLDPNAYCDVKSFTNNLSWTYQATGSCDPNVIEYKIYFSPAQGQQFKYIGSQYEPSKSFEHQGLPSYAGCYYVTAMNKYGNESEPSNIVCKENCPIFRLPNVFTPNGDNVNDVFKPFPCPAFVKSIEFKVFNRWGVKVFETRDMGINWDGKNSSGQDLPAAQYFYELALYPESADQNVQPVKSKGWIQLLR